MKKLLLMVPLVLVAALAAVALFAPTPAQAASKCSIVRCAACPDGYHLKLQPPDCCRCIRN